MVLARANRIVRGDDYRAIVRGGIRRSTAHSVIYRRPAAGGDSRFGFIVAKNVGNAVRRNLVRRRMKAIAFAQLQRRAPQDIVIRALPGSAETAWATLNAEISEGLDESGWKA